MPYYASKQQIVFTCFFLLFVKMVGASNTYKRHDIHIQHYDIDFGSRI